jgi:ABC-2 type transport system permease protein
MNAPLLKFFVRKNWKLWAIFAGIITFYLGVIVVMATDPMMVEAMGFLNLETATEALGITEATLALNITVAIFQGMIMYVFVMIFYVLLVQKILYKAVDTTSMSSILATPISRRQYIITAYLFLVGCLFVFYLWAFLLTATCLITYSGSFSWTGLLSVHLSTFLCTLMVATISFACSAIFANTKAGMPLLAGIPIAFAALMMLSMYLPFFEYLTPFMWIDAMELVTRTFKLWWLFNLVFITISAAAFTATLYIFKRKQLSI